ncbi:MAG: SpaH/EbpB family LPXTG-anchored major pilin [Ancrocorticia sp.]
MSIRQRRKIPALLGALAASLALTFTGTMASAAPTIPDVDPDTRGSITFHKYDTTGTGGPTADGTEITDPTELASLGSPIADVTFTITQVAGIDLTTNAGWTAAAQLDETTAKNQLDPATIKTAGPTNAAGLATIEDLPVGLYYVEETLAPAQVTKAPPFLISIPLTDPADQSNWFYDIHVYPKNDVSTGTKTVQDSARSGNDQTFTWTVQGDIPTVPVIDAYKIRDDFDSRLEFDAAGLTACLSVDDTNPSTCVGGATDLVPADYTVTTYTRTQLDAWRAANPNDLTCQPVMAADKGLRVEVTLTATGLAKMAARNDVEPTSKVQLTVPTRLTATAINDASQTAGIVKNSATVFPNGGSFCAKDGETPPPTNESESRWGDILIHKIDATNHATTLAGATFQVYVADANGAKTGSALNLPVLDANGQPTFNPDGSLMTENEFTTDANGIVKISALRNTNFADGYPQKPYCGDATCTPDNQSDTDTGTVNPKYQRYVLEEITAPTGYELLAKPLLIEVTAAGQVIAADGTGGLDIENAPTNNGFELPMTGAAGTAMFTLIGLGLLGLGTLMVARRRQATK